MTKTTGREVVPHQPNGTTPLTLGKAAELDPFKVGAILAQSGFFPDAKQEAQAVAKVIAGMEMGFGPMAAMSGVHIIEGKPSLSANLLAACVKRHPRYDYRVREHGEKGCRIEFFEAGESIGESEFSLEDAQRAGIATRPNFKRYPRAMMFARALTQGVRWFCPDVTAGAPAYTPEELGAEVNEEGEPVIESSAQETAADATSSSSSGGHAEGEREVLDSAATLIDDERARLLYRGVQSLGPTLDDLNLLLGTVGAEGAKLNRPDSIAKAIRELTPEQADKFDVLLQREADRGSE